MRDVAVDRTRQPMRGFAVSCARAFAPDQGSDLYTSIFKLAKLPGRLP